MNDLLILRNHLLILMNDLLINHLFILINALFVHFGLPYNCIPFGIVHGNIKICTSTENPLEASPFPKFCVDVTSYGVHFIIYMFICRRNTFGKNSYHIPIGVRQCCRMKWHEYLW